MLKDRILERLREAGAGEYVSGQELCEALGVSRTAVWKAVSRLREEGYPIEAVQNRGYRLDEARAESNDLLNEAELNARLSAATRWAGHPCYYAEETGSTNDDIMALADQGAPEGTLCVTSLQNKGKGRRGRRWISPDGGNVYMSLLVRPKMPTNIVPMVTIVMALAACEACQEVAGGATVEDIGRQERGQAAGAEVEAGAAVGSGENICLEKGVCPAAAGSGDQCVYPARFGIKWPNDIVINGKKICGILTEMSAQFDYINHIVIGIGINVHNESFPEELQDHAGSLLLECGKRVHRADLIETFLEEFERLYAIYLQTEDLSALQEEYDQLLVNRGRQVRVLDPKEPFEGKAMGITKKGELIVDTWESRKLVSSGEVSVRGIYGYV